MNVSESLDILWFYQLFSIFEPPISMFYVCPEWRSNLKTNRFHNAILNKWFQEMFSLLIQSISGKITVFQFVLQQRPGQYAITIKCILMNDC